MADYMLVADDFKAGTILQRSSPILREYLAAIAFEPIRNEMIRHHALIMADHINQILLQRHLDAMQKRADRMQWLFLALTVAGVIAALAQVYVALCPR